MPNPSSIPDIRKVAVLGAGTMGSRIAAHIANAGLPVVLLDIVPPGTAPDAPKAERNKFVLAALEGLKKSKPAALYIPDSARLITLGNFDDDLALLADCDWIIEVVAENLEIKRALLRRFSSTVGPGRSPPRTPPACPSPGSSKECPKTSATTGSEPTSSIRRAICACSRSSPRPSRTPPTSPLSPTSAISAWASPSCPRMTRPTSSPTASEPFRWATPSA